MKDILKIAAFTVILILMIGLLGFPFRGGYWYLRGYLADRDCRIAGIQEEPEGQVDVLSRKSLRDRWTCSMWETA